MKYAYDIILLADKDWKIYRSQMTGPWIHTGITGRNSFNLHLWDLLSDHYFMTEPEKMEREAQAGFRFEATNCRQDGSTFPAEISSSLIEME